MTSLASSLTASRALRTLIAAGLLGAGALAQAMTAPEALAVMQGQGYHAVYDLEKEYGHWTAKAVSPEGARTYLLVNDASGQLQALTRADLGARLPGAAQVAERLRGMGYAQVRDIEFDDGLWEAEVRQSANAPKVELVLHPVTLDVLGQSSAATGGQGATVLTAAQVTHTLQAAGYSHVRDLELDDGRWEAEATNTAGQRVDLYVNASTGAVEREKLDD
ncbi:MAG: PepSY domain-containing protein [Pseudomonadota bacterium]|nr:PepSY domain-containing protein [Pseudomonadota bacterium]